MNEYECPICGGKVKSSGFNGNWFCWGKCYTYGLIPKYIEVINSQKEEIERLKGCIYDWQTEAHQNI